MSFGDPRRYARCGRFVSDLGQPVVDWLAPCAGEAILDLGCGDGVLTAAIATSGAKVTGIDSVAAMVEAARALGVDARVLDAHALPFTEAFDAVFSNAALHWMRDLDAVVAGVGRALKPGGRFVGEFGGEGNIETVRSALHRALRDRGIDPARHDPWRFPAAAELSALLARHGFERIEASCFHRPTPVPGDLADWLELFANSLLAAAGDQRDDVIAEVIGAAAPSLRDAAGCWSVDYVRLRFRAFRKGCRS